MRRASPIHYVAQVVTPTLVCLGGKDKRVPPSQGWEYHHVLKAQGVPTRCVKAAAFSRCVCGWVFGWFCVFLVCNGHVFVFQFVYVLCLFVCLLVVFVIICVFNGSVGVSLNPAYLLTCSLFFCSLLFFAF